MTLSALAVATQKLLRCPSVCCFLGTFGETPSVYPVKKPDAAAVPAIIVNRTFEQTDEGLITAILVLTCLANTVPILEDLGSAVIDSLDGCQDFEFGGERDITFAKAGYDITGFDDKTGLFMRQIEFSVTW